MKPPPFAQRVVADIVFHERQPGPDDWRDVVQWQMPDTVMRLFRAEARRRGTDVNTLIRDFLCDFLTERAEALQRGNTERDARSSER